MLKLEVKGTEYYDEKNNTFFSVPSETLYLEHSLLSLTKWEAKYKMSFLERISNDKDGLTVEETLYYIKCMVINEPKNEDIFYLF